ncbi:MAG: hypothetical protein KGP12_06475 [Actinomycetales bacterium]|nr:hypothetical protein [Actinomycetales bacterium]
MIRRPSNPYARRLGGILAVSLLSPLLGLLPGSTAAASPPLALPAQDIAIPSPPAASAPQSRPTWSVQAPQAPASTTGTASAS